MFEDGIARLEDMLGTPVLVLSTIVPNLLET